MAERRVKIPLYNYDYNYKEVIAKPLNTPNTLKSPISLFRVFSVFCGSYKEVIAEPLNTRKTRNHNFPFFSTSYSEKRQRHGKKPFPNDSLKVN